jgi:uncharacterized membrane protein (UPF0127 family)
MRKIIAVILLVIFATTLYAGYLLSRPAGVRQIEFGGVILSVEIVTTPADQERGLSFRDSIPTDHGMLFVFQSEGMWGFWMKGMRFPLDIVWFDSQKRVVFMEQNLAPCTPQSCPPYTPPVNTMYVLEVNAGFVQAHNVALGDAFSFR